MSRPVAVLGALVLAAFGPALAADEKKDDKTALRGTWTYESMEWDGKKIAADQINQTTVTFDGDKFTVKVGDKVTMTGTYKSDPAKTPKTVDATLTEGQGKGNTALGIYKLDGDTITACIKLTGRERPKEFKTTDQSDTVLVVARRVKK